MLRLKGTNMLKSSLTTKTNRRRRFNVVLAHNDFRVSQHKGTFGTRKLILQQLCMLTSALDCGATPVLPRAIAHVHTIVLQPLIWLLMALNL
jgi:hypothetical protein